MSYCPIDEAFGNFMTDGFGPHPLESTSFEDRSNSKCEKKKKVKRNRINCNKDASRFSENLDDLYYESPEVTDEDIEFDETLNGYSSLNNIGLYSITEKPPTKNRKSKLSRKKSRPTKQSSNNMQILEGFTSNNNNEMRTNVVRKPRRTNRKPKEVNEVFEYDESDNISVEDLREIHGNEEGDQEESENDEVTPTKHREPSTGMNSQISEINNKINFIMNQISNKDNDITESQHNNIHDIVLFVIFGIFVLIILEALYRLITKMITANTILSNNITNTSMNQAPTITSNGDAFEVVTQYAKNRQ
jgi:hypothetical protein